jgi:hypothetical protein
MLGRLCVTRYFLKVFLSNVYAPTEENSWAGAGKDNRAMADRSLFSREMA